MAFGNRVKRLAADRPSGRLAQPSGCNEDEADARHINARGSATATGCLHMHAALSCNFG